MYITLLMVFKLKGVVFLGMIFSLPVLCDQFILCCALLCGVVVCMQVSSATYEDDKNWIQVMNKDWEIQESSNHNRSNFCHC